MQNVLFEAGQTIFSEGDPSTHTYRIQAGSVDIVILGHDGDQRRIASLGPDEIFGEMGIIDPAPRSATAIAREPTACEVYTADEVIDLMSNDPEKAIDWLRSLIMRLRASNRKLAAKSVPGQPKPPI
ncbi:MAG: cyclic nucleotide-binding domain-containing protein [Pseudomonadota bacterium]